MVSRYRSWGERTAGLAAAAAVAAVGAVGPGAAGPGAATAASTSLQVCWMLCSRRARPPSSSSRGQPLLELFSALRVLLDCRWEVYVSTT